jgi:hypothetical protein
MSLSQRTPGQWEGAFTAKEESPTYIEGTPFGHTVPKRPLHRSQVRCDQREDDVTDVMYHLLYEKVFGELHYACIHSSVRRGLNPAARIASVISPAG